MRSTCVLPNVPPRVLEGFKFMTGPVGRVLSNSPPPPPPPLLLNLATFIYEHHLKLTEYLYFYFDQDIIFPKSFKGQKGPGGFRGREG